MSLADKAVGGDEKALKSSEPIQAAEDVPDPDEGDLDDLDDMLDEFSAVKVEEKPPEPERPIAGAGTGATDSTPHGATTAADDFDQQLQNQMAALMGSMDESPEMKKEIEAMMQELGATADASASGSSKSGPSEHAPRATTSTGSDIPFQETIRKTMERMQVSGEQASAAAKSGDEDDMLAQLMKELQGDGKDVPDNEGFNKMLLGMMEQLTNKEILYEPMKELHDKFPAWLAENRSKTKADDLRRYETQQKLVGEIVGRFERKGYSDENSADREFIVERMQQMQAAGSPPPDLAGDMNAAQEALGDIDAGCPQQ